MQEIICEVNPDFIIETGTYQGGTALFYAVLLDNLNKNGTVIAVDLIEPHPKIKEYRVWQERVEFIQGGDCVSDEVIDKIAAMVEGHRVLVTLDSCHTQEHVLKELGLYSKFVSLNSYIVVQDTHLGGHPNNVSAISNLGGHLNSISAVPKGHGPMEAVDEFLEKNENFYSDRTKEKYWLTQNPKGFLKRIK